LTQCSEITPGHSSIVETNISHHPATKNINQREGPSNLKILFTWTFPRDGAPTGLKNLDHLNWEENKFYFVNVLG
jgi:hypothetical protein